MSAIAIGAEQIEFPGGVQGDFPDEGGPPPVRIRPLPGGDASTDGLVGWLGANRDLVARTLPRAGALLFRGFSVDGPADFERVARAIDPNLQKDYLGTSPRDAMTEYVFSASELPGFYPIPQHSEMTFVKKPPRRLFFWCAVEPQGPGGETPLCDARRVWRDLDPAVRARFEERGVRVIRNYCGPEGGSRFDLWRLKPWHEMFRTTERARVEELCRENGFDFAWQTGGRLRLTNVQPAMHAHPDTGEIAWFNHSQVFHLSAVPDEFRRIAARQRPLKSTALRLFGVAMVALKRRTTAVEDQAMHCTYGDGGEIPDSDMDRVRDAIWKNMVFVRWRRGDVVAIDNYAVTHGRMPYEGPRTVAVCWA